MVIVHEDSGCGGSDDLLADEGGERRGRWLRGGTGSSGSRGSRRSKKNSSSGSGSSSGKSDGDSVNRVGCCYWGVA